MSGRYDVWLENHIMPEMAACSPSIRQNPRINPQQNFGFARGSVDCVEKLEN
jgi:hypothetical protein